MNIINEQILIDAAIHALERTAMVLAEPAPARTECSPPTRFARILYSGPSQGTLILGANDSFLLDLAASLLGVGTEDVSVDVQGVDALRELTNILGGSVIVAMSGETCEYSLGLPELCDGAPLTAESPPHASQSAACAVVAEEGILRVLWIQNAEARAA